MQDITFVTCAHDAWGAESSLALLAKEFIRRGHAIIFVAREGAALDYLAKEVPEAKTVAVPSRRSRVAQLLETARAVPKADSLVVVFSLDLMPLPWLARGRPMIFDIHDTPPKLITRRAMKLLARSYVGAIAISKYAASWGEGFRNVVVVPRPITRFATPKEYKAAKEKLCVGIVGRISPEKNIEFAIESVKAAREQGIAAELVIYGEHFGNQKSYMESVLALGTEALGSSFIWKSRRPASEIYGDIDVLMVANGREPSGRTVGEAMGAGLPVLVPDCGGAREYLTDGAEGVVYRHGDVESVVSSLRMLESSELRARMGRLGADRIQKERRASVIAASYLKGLAL